METSLLFSDFVKPVSPAASYIGGKRRLARSITTAIDRMPHTTYAEAFIGMGGVFLRRGRKPQAEVINDWSEDVANFFRILQRHYVAFLDMLKFQLTTRSGFERLLRVDPSTQTDLERAARFLYPQRLAFGGKVHGRTFGVDPATPAAFNVVRLAPVLEEIHERLASVVIERLSWESFLMRYDREGTLFYLDPPYYGCESDYGPALFDRSQFDRMASLLGSLSGQFLLSLNDLPEVRAIFARFAMVQVTLQYGVGGGAVEAKEVIISSLPAERLGDQFPASIAL
jgi:DNA adenine methylase